MASFVPLLGDTLVQPDGSSVPTSGLDCEVLALYFSAVWCGPCQAFTPVLSDKYSSLKADGKKFQVVFVSSDKSQEDFDGYFKKMPWLALPFAQRDVKKMLSRKFKVGSPMRRTATSRGALRYARMGYAFVHHRAMEA
mmetsp:Transcript_70102/g.222203  ORF Transcript_70102/g.222203 Transcript_70102/m.222203 type:complete len:138 (+) Transcript_70102:38-451(+)